MHHLAPPVLRSLKHTLSHTLTAPFLQAPTTALATLAPEQNTPAQQAQQAQQPLLQPCVPDWVEALLPPPLPPAATRIRSARLQCSAYTRKQLPPPRPAWPEVAVLGRSNVGKSSLVNYLLAASSSSSSSSSSSLARVSKTPGRTTSINLYAVHSGASSQWMLTDCPGYGYARASAAARADWHALTRTYLAERGAAGCLADVLLLLDASLPPREADLAGVAWLQARRLPVTLVFTKCDKEKRGEPAPAHNVAAFRQRLDEAGLLAPAAFATVAAAAGAGSGAAAAAQRGRPELLAYLARRLAAHQDAAQTAARAGLLVAR